MNARRHTLLVLFPWRILTKIKTDKKHLLTVRGLNGEDWSRSWGAEAYGAPCGHGTSARGDNRSAPAEADVRRDGDGLHVSAQGPGPAHLHCCTSLRLSAGRRARGRGPASWGHACCTPEGRNLHSGSPLPRDSQLTLNKALSTFESTSPSRAENNKTAHAICKRTSSSFVQGGY